MDSTSEDEEAEETDFFLERPKVMAPWIFGGAVRSSRLARLAVSAQVSRVEKAHGRHVRPYKGMRPKFSSCPRPENSGPKIAPSGRPAQDREVPCYNRRVSGQ